MPLNFAPGPSCSTSSTRAIKLAYFLQLTGENLRLEYRAHFYGPFADTLRKALRNIEGHYTRGIGDGKKSPETPLEMVISKPLWRAYSSRVGLAPIPRK